MIVRSAVESDRDAIAALIVHAFSKHFSRLDKSPARIAGAIGSSLMVDHCFVAEQQDVAGVIITSSPNSHAFHIDKKAFTTRYGWFKGGLAAYFIKREFQPKVALTGEAMYIEIVAVDERARGRGVASAMLRHLFSHTDGAEYYLEVIDTNEAAIHLYQKLGFVEVSRKKERLARMTGFKYRIIMKYVKRPVTRRAPDGCKP